MSTKKLFCTIPHSGEKIPDFCDWLQGLSEPHLMRDIDRYVDLLYVDILKDLQIPLVKTEWHRYAVDLNRIPSDVDASTLEGSVNPPGSFTRGYHWGHTTLKEKLLTRPLTSEEHSTLTKLIYEPFHLSVANQVDALKKSGAASIYHLDLHSMPSVGTAEHRDPGERRADVVISDSLGKSSDPSFVNHVILCFTRAGLKVSYNWPYYGGRLTEQYGQPAKNHHCVQIELSRDLYMNEETKKLIPEKAKALQIKLAVAMKTVCTYLD